MGLCLPQPSNENKSSEPPKYLSGIFQFQRNVSVCLRVKKKNSLRVQPTHGQSKPEPSNSAQTRLHAHPRHLAEQARPSRTTPRPDDIRSDRRAAPDVLRRVWPSAVGAIIIAIFVRVVAGAGVVGAPACGGGECVGEDSCHVRG